MNVIDWAIRIFEGKEISDKLLDSSSIDDYRFKNTKIDLSTPGRSKDISFSSKKIKFPKKIHLKEESNRAKALAFFANHELEAIEMMCAALIKFGGSINDDEFYKLSRGVVSSIKDEQRHLSLYLNRLHDFGKSISDYPLNDFFWKQFESIESFDDFFSLMSLTFEAANLDFCLFYEKIFYEFGDEQTAQIMRNVFIDEISHVKLGVYWLNRWRKDDALWDYYVSHLPQNISPERSKGIEFSLSSRTMSGLDQEFLKSLIDYKSDFLIPKRKTNSNAILQNEF